MVFAALLAGIAAGLATSAVQAARLWPLIDAAELLESHGNDGHVHGPAGWSPHGALRPALTVLFNMAAGIGFALMLNAAARLRELRSGVGLTVGEGVGWGAAGFAAFALAPALGLPPALPGMAEGALLARQIWWVATAGCTLGGIAMLAWAGGAWRGVGVALMALPHLAGAPVAGHGGTVPGDVAAAFVAGSLAASAVFWVVLGGVSGWVQQRWA